MELTGRHGVAPPGLGALGRARVHAHPPLAATHARASLPAILHRVEQRITLGLVLHRVAMAVDGAAQDPRAQVPHVIVHGPARSPLLAPSGRPQVQAQGSPGIAVELEHHEAGRVPGRGRRPIPELAEQRPQLVAGHDLVTTEPRHRSPGQGLPRAWSADDDRDRVALINAITGYRRCHGDREPPPRSPPVADQPPSIVPRSASTLAPSRSSSASPVPDPTARASRRASRARRRRLLTVPCGTSSASLSSRVLSSSQ